MSITDGIHLQVMRTTKNKADYKKNKTKQNTMADERSAAFQV